MYRALLAATILCVVATTLPACESRLDRGMEHCREQYFGYTRAQCEQQMRRELGR